MRITAKDRVILFGAFEEALKQMGRDIHQMKAKVKKHESRIKNIELIVKKGVISESDLL